MNDQQLLRYSRHILLDEIGIEGQERLLGGHALPLRTDDARILKLVSQANNVLDMNIMRSALARDPHCHVCSNTPTEITIADLVDAAPPQHCRSSSCSC